MTCRRLRELQSLEENGYLCVRLNYHDTKFLSAKWMEALILNWCGKRVITLTFFIGWFIRWDSKVQKSVMENWETAQKEGAPQRSPTLTTGHFPETVARLTYLWHAVLSEGCALKGNTKLASTDYSACTDVAYVFWWYILILTYSHSFFCFAWTNTSTV